MTDQINLFDMLPEEDGSLYKALQSTDWKWTMANDYPPSNGLKVFSCFACGGGSTMGYKLAGCDVLGCCEIDKRMNEIYVANHHPKYNYLMDIREFNKLEDLPEELYHLDILDGSPPCTTFSMAGDREETWGKEKKFREGQSLQTLDDLSFVFIETAKKLKPKVVIMENVEGLLLGEAWAYVQQIYKDFHEAGYSVWHWLLKGEQMGVPQTRHRVFFVAINNELGIDPSWLDMSFNYAPIPYGEIKENGTNPLRKDSQTYQLIGKALPKETSIGDVNMRLHNKLSGFQTYLISEKDIVPTIRANPDIIDRDEKGYVSKESLRNAQTFPRDYDFVYDTRTNTCFVLGMSVPPVMTKRVVQRLIDEGVFNYKINA